MKVTCRDQKLTEGWSLGVKRVCNQGGVTGCLCQSYNPLASTTEHCLIQHTRLGLLSALCSAATFSFITVLQHLGEFLG